MVTALVKTIDLYYSRLITTQILGDFDLDHESTKHIGMENAIVWPMVEPTGM